MFVSGAAEVIETDEPDAERNGETDEHDDERRERDERPSTTEATRERTRGHRRLRRRG
jgi:hypothetical protein